jgi:hypothetical protein
MKNKLPAFYCLISIEATIWITGILLLAFLPFNNGNHFTICPLNNLGFNFCPGCGLGSSIHYLLHLNFLESFNAHPLGIIALPILIFRIITLSKPACLQAGKHFFKKNHQ